MSSRYMVNLNARAPVLVSSRSGSRARGSGAGGVSAWSMEVSGEQWEEARRLFDEGLPESVGMPMDKRDTILHMLDVWHELSGTERKLMSNGNHIYWNRKYMVVGDADNEEGVLCFKESGEWRRTPRR